MKDHIKVSDERVEITKRLLIQRDLVGLFVLGLIIPANAIATGMLPSTIIGIVVGGSRLMDLFAGAFEKVPYKSSVMLPVFMNVLIVAVCLLAPENPVIFAGFITLFGAVAGLMATNSNETIKLIISVNSTQLSNRNFKSKRTTFRAIGSLSGIGCTVLILKFIGDENWRIIYYVMGIMNIVYVIFNLRLYRSIKDLEDQIKY